MEAVQTTANAVTASPAAIHSNSGSEKTSLQSKENSDLLGSLPPVFYKPAISIGSSDSFHRQEADNVAAKVMRKELPPPLHFSPGKNSIQRKCAHCEAEKKNDSLATSSIFYQPKLTVASADSFYEEEADDVAEKVMRMKSPEPLSFSPVNNHIHRKCAHCEAEEKEVHRKESSSEPVSVAPRIVHDVLNSSQGRTMDQGTRSFMEPRFGHDFTNVKIHDNQLAAKSASSINALAYTSGNNIVFNSGQYNTNSDSGKRLLAHELTHVVQQTGGHPAKGTHSSDSMVSSHAPRQISRLPTKTGTVPNPTSVSIIRISCDSMTIEFDTNAGVFSFELVDCDITGDLDYMADVTVSGNDVNFSGPEDSDANASFNYRIAAGQPNPSTFFRSQKTVHIVTGVLANPLPGTGTPGPGTPAGPLVCARPLANKFLGKIANHAFVNDPILGNNYAIRDLVSGNGFKGCTTKTTASPPPDTPATSLCKPCLPQAGKTASDVSQCLKSVHDAYANPNLYRNWWDRKDGFKWGPNSNTYAATLAKCCTDSTDSGLGNVPGWNHSPAIPCPDTITIDEDAEPQDAEAGPKDAGAPGGAPAGCIQPINWTHGNARNHGAEAIRVDISWASSSGALPDLKDCTVREVVNYDPIPDPPFTGWNPSNPTILTVPGVDGAATDTHQYSPGVASITKVAGTSVAHQVYQWKCTGAGCDGAWHDFPSQHYTMTRDVSGSGSTWFYKITKTGGNGFNFSRTVPIP